MEKRIFADNHFYNILRLCDVLPSSPFTTSEPWYIRKRGMYKHGIYEFPHELSSDLKLRKLGEIRKVFKVHRTIA